MALRQNMDTLEEIRQWGTERDIPNKEENEHDSHSLVSHYPRFGRDRMKNIKQI